MDTIGKFQKKIACQVFDKTLIINVIETNDLKSLKNKPQQR
jgi:hypothetical protein